MTDQELIDLSAIPKAKDLIDQLGSKMVVLMRKEDDALHEVFRLKGTVEHLQDKLAKAMTGLRKIADHKHFVAHLGWTQNAEARIAIATLAELGLKE